MTIKATNQPIRTLTRGMRRCPRCGLVREARKTATLCGSCIDTTTPAEQAVWAA